MQKASGRGAQRPKNSMVMGRMRELSQGYRGPRGLGRSTVDQHKETKMRHERSSKKQPIKKARGSSAKGSAEARGSTETANNEDDDIWSGIVDDTLEEEANNGDATIEMGDESDGDLVSVTKAKIALLQDKLIRTEHTVTSCFIDAAALGTKLKFEHDVICRTRKTMDDLFGEQMSRISNDDDFITLTLAP